MYTLKPHLSTDFYKVSHGMNTRIAEFEGFTNQQTFKSVPALHPEGIEYLYETLTPRANSYFPYDDKMVAFGYELFVVELIKTWKENFFNKPWAELVTDFDVFEHMSSPEVHRSMVSKFHKLHQLGYLPLEIRALPEGTLVPMRVPVLSIVNTEPDFYWLPGYLETTLLANTFVTSSVASVARQFRKIGQRYADLTAESNAFLDFQFHDFSQRGQHGDEASVVSGLAHLTAFKGSDAIPAVAAAMDMWSETDKGELIGASVVATEHSIMEALGGQFGTDTQGQIDAWESLIDRNPNGILSVVADTYDYWEVVDVVLPALKDKILARNGKLVLRPDSLSEERVSTGERINTVGKQLSRTLDALYETFGGTINAKGYKVLNEHVGVLHGEGVTLENIETIFDEIVDAGFSTENMVFGVGAFVYSVKISRDDFAQALKASACVINGKETMIFKKPKSEAEAFKRSPKGAVSIHGESGEYFMIEQLSMDEARRDPDNKMALIYSPETEAKVTPLKVIRQRIQNELDK